MTQDGTTCAIDTPEGEKVERCMQDAGVSKLDKVLISTCIVPPSDHDPASHHQG